MVTFTDNEWNLPQGRKVSRNGEERGNRPSNEGWYHATEEEFRDRYQNEARDHLLAIALDRKVKRNQCYANKAS